MSLFKQLLEASMTFTEAHTNMQARHETVAQALGVASSSKHENIVVNVGDYEVTFKTDEVFNIKCKVSRPIAMVFIVNKTKPLDFSVAEKVTDAGAWDKLDSRIVTAAPHGVIAAPRTSSKKQYDIYAFTAQGVKKIIAAVASLKSP